MQKFDCLNSGLNIREGGGGGKQSEQTKRKISQAHAGKTLTDSHKANLKLAKRVITETTRQKLRNANMGKKYSEETREKHRQKMLGNQRTKGMTSINAKKVINTQTGEIMASICSAAKSLNMPRRTLTAMLSGQNSNKSTFKYL
jgi:hypothetical protein